MKQYACLMIDMIQSRSYSDNIRSQIQKDLIFYMERLNRVFKLHLVHAMTCSAGDEVQGLFLDLESAYLYFRLLEGFLYPVQLRGGIGIGAWTIQITGVSTNFQDGPVYHFAREAIERAEHSKNHNLILVGSQKDDFCTYLMNVSNELKNQHNVSQNMIWILSELYVPFTTEKMNWEYSLRNELISYKKKETICIDDFNTMILIDGTLQDGEAKVAVRSLSQDLSKLLGCTRQNVEKLMKRGNVLKIREMDYMAVQYLKQLNGGKL